METLEDKDSKLPLQLCRLPQTHIKRVCDALAILKQTGLDEIDSVQELQGKTAKLLDRIDAGGTSYETMCRWCQTQRLWLKADRIDPQTNCTLDGLTDQERAAKCEELEESQKEERKSVDDSTIQQEMDEIRRRIERRSARVITVLANRENETGLGLHNHREHFNAWVESQLAAERELRLLASNSEFVPKFLGNGHKVLFASQSDEPMRPVPKEKRFVQAVTPWQDMEKETSENDTKQTKLSKRVFAGSRPAIITTHVGSAGCMMAESYWNQLISEHAINSDGTYTNDPIGCIATSFDEKPKGSLLPRAVLVDTGSNNVNLPDCIKQEEVTRHNGSLTNWAAVYMDEYSSVVDATMEKMRLQLEKCDMVNSLLLTYAMYEEFGGAISLRLFDKVREELPKTTLWAFPLVPVAANCEAPSIYNTFFGLCGANRNCNLVTCADQSSACAPGKPSQEHLMAQVLAACSSPLRLSSAIPASEGSFSISPSTMANNLCPYPYANWTFPVCSMAAGSSTPDYVVKQDQNSALFSCFTKGNLLSQNVSANEGRYMSIGLYYRNKDLPPTKAIQKLKRQRLCRFVDWMPTGFQVAWQSESIPNRSPFEKQVVGICNSTCFKKALTSWAKMFEGNISKRDDWQQYRNHGIDDAFLSHHREFVAGLEADMTELEINTD